VCADQKGYNVSGFDVVDFITLATNLPSLISTSGMVVDIAGGNTHAIAQLNNGSIVGWTDLYSNPTALRMPSGRSVVQIAGGAGTSLLVLDSGELLQWGTLDSIILLEFSSTPDVLYSPPSVMAAAAGKWHALVLLRNGTLKGYGNNTFGQVRIPTSLQTPGSGAVQVAAGLEHSLVLTSNGQVYAFGLNNYGQTTLPAAVQAGGVRKIGAGGWTSYALMAGNNGQLIAWGFDVSLKAVQSLTNVVDFSAGAFHVSVLLSSGEVHVYGTERNSHQVVITARVWSSCTLKVPHMSMVGKGQAHKLLLPYCPCWFCVQPFSRPVLDARLSGFSQGLAFIGWSGREIWLAREKRRSGWVQHTGNGFLPAIMCLRNHTHKLIYSSANILAEPKAAFALKRKAGFDFKSWRKPIAPASVSAGLWQGRRLRLMHKQVQYQRLLSSSLGSAPGRGRSNRG
jgi:hypothetical protein